MKFKKKRRKPFIHVNIIMFIFFSFMDYLDRWYFVVELIAFQVVLMHLNAFDPFELFLLNVVVVMQEQI